MVRTLKSGRKDTSLHETPVIRAVTGSTWSHFSPSPYWPHFRSCDCVAQTADWCSGKTREVSFILTEVSRGFPQYFQVNVGGERERQTIWAFIHTIHNHLPTSFDATHPLQLKQSRQIFNNILVTSDYRNHDNLLNTYRHKCSASIPGRGIGIFSSSPPPVCGSHNRLFSACARARVLTILSYSTEHKWQQILETAF